MKIYIHPNVFNSEPAWKNLDRLFILIEDRRYEWLLKIESDLDDFANSTYLDAQPHYKYDIYSELAKGTFSKNGMEGNNQNERVINIITTKDLNFYLKFLEQPLYIILEHIENDKHFLDTLFRCFKNASKKINKSIEKKWISFLHAGGKDGVIPNIKNKLGEIPPRIFVLLDSDRKFRDEPLSRGLSQALEFCDSCNTANNIQYHVTHKREIENYLPDSVLLALTDTEQNIVYGAYSQLSPEQKDFYDLEKGFDDKSSAIGQEALFEGIEEQVFSNLRKGFALNKKFDTKKVFPRLFTNEQHVSQNTLMSRCSHQPQPDELKELLESIKILL